MNCIPTKNYLKTKINIVIFDANFVSSGKKHPTTGIIAIIKAPIKKSWYIPIGVVWKNDGEKYDVDKTRKEFIQDVLPLIAPN